MRMNLITESCGRSRMTNGTLALSMTIRPAYGMPGDYSYTTDSASVLRLLRRSTDLPTTVLKKFEGDLYTMPKAKLLGVELSEQTLTEIGYFID